MPLLLPGALAWYADPWIERTVVAGMFAALLGASPLAERLWRAHGDGIATADLRDATPRDISALRTVVDQLIADGRRGASGAVALPPHDAGYLTAVTRLAAMLAGFAVSMPAPTAAYLHYEAGSAHAPDSPMGHDLIQVRDDGVLYAENRRGSQIRTVMARVGADQVASLHRALATTSFPHVPATPRLPGGGPVRLGVRDVAGHRAAVLPQRLSDTEHHGYRSIVDVLAGWAGRLHREPDPRASGVAPVLDDIVDIVASPWRDDIVHAAWATDAARRARAPSPRATVITAAEAVGHGLPPLGMRVDADGTAMIVSVFPDAGTYLVASGPPGAPLSFEVAAVDEREHDAAAIRRLIEARCRGPASMPDAWGPPSSLSLAGAARPALVFMSGRAMFRTAGVAALIVCPAGSLLVIARCGVRPGTEMMTGDAIVGVATMAPLIGSFAIDG